MSIYNLFQNKISKVFNSKILYALNQIFIHLCIYKILGNKYYAIIGYILVIESFSIIFEIFYASYFSKEFSDSKNSKSKLQFLWSNLIVLSIILFVIFVILCFFLNEFFWLSIFDQLNEFLLKNNYVYSLVISFFSLMILAVRIFSSIFKGILIGLNLQLYIAKISNFSVLFRISLVLIALVLGLNIIYLILFLFISSLYECIFLYKKINSHIKFGKQHINIIKFFNKTKQFGFQISMLGLTNILLMNFDKIAVSYFLELSQTGDYLFLRNLCNVLYIVSISKGDVIFPNLNKSFIYKKFNQVNLIINNYFVFIIKNLFPIILYSFFLFSIFRDILSSIKINIGIMDRDVLTIILLGSYFNILNAPAVKLQIITFYFKKAILLNLFLIVIYFGAFFLFYNKINLFITVVLMLIYNFIFFLGNFLIVKNKYNKLLKINIIDIIKFHFPVILISVILISLFIILYENGYYILTTILFFIILLIHYYRIASN